MLSIRIFHIENTTHLANKFTAPRKTIKTVISEKIFQSCIILNGNGYHTYYFVHLDYPRIFINVFSKDKLIFSKKNGENSKQNKKNKAYSRVIFVSSVLLFMPPCINVDPQII